MPSHPPAFEETQRPAPWVFLLLGIGATGALLAAGLVRGTAVLAAELLLVALALVLAALMAAARMHIRVDTNGVHIRTLAVIRRDIPFAAIAAAEAVRYRPVRDWGGWGIRRNREGRAITMRGDRGVRLTLADGSLLLIGSARADALAARPP